MSEFCHLHLHSSYSLLDGANRIADVIERAAQSNMPAIALTDHGNLFGAVQFHDSALRQGVKPIIGCEVYVARNGRLSREGRSSQSNHLILLAKDDRGYHNLVKLVSNGYLEGYYYRPRVDKELLANHSEGLICLSACLQGIVAWNLIQERFEDARREAGELAEIFGDGNFFLELQDHGIEEQKTVNGGILKLAKALGLPLVATNDCHYLEASDASAHDVLLCIQTGKTIDDPNRLSYKTKEFFFKSGEEMHQLFGHVPGALKNTLLIAEKCNFRLGETQNIFPEFKVPPGYTVDGYFEEVVRNGFEERLKTLRTLEQEGRLRHKMSEYSLRLDLEIGVIQHMHFSAYFLIVWDFIRYAREMGIPVGPGRGSAAGSLVAYALRITDVDPLQYDLLFERFLNPERVSPPDIDIDFCMNRRGEVIDYVTSTYGRENVSHIITFGTMAARGALRDVGRGMNIPYAEVDRIAKLVPQGPDATIARALENVKELRELAESDSRYKELVSVARRLEGLPRHASTHAAGVVIAPQPLIELIPLHKSTKSDEITTQYPMSDLERLGLLKMDFLGLTTLTVIEQTLCQIRDQLAKEVDLTSVPLDDPKTLQLFCDGRTSGIFQFESAGMRDILRRLQPSRFEDLIALNALYRPGPIQGGMIDDFIDRRHGRVTVTYEVPELEEILKETYGVIVYQEQVMQVAGELAGYAMGEADILRRAMGKKKKSVMENQRKKFLAGAKERGFDQNKAKRIFELMEQFAGYGFNKSHSTAYALLAYRTALLKAHYPVQFMAALLTSEMSNTDKVVQYLGECREMGIHVLPPDIRTGFDHFEGTAAGEIKFGLAAIRNVGEGAIRATLESRAEAQGFKDFFDFCEKIDPRQVNKRVLESLIKAGALDSFGHPRKSLIGVLDRALEGAQKAQRDRISGQKGLFSSLVNPSGEEPAPDIPDLGEWTESEKWAYEKETLGFYLSGHPLLRYEAELRRFSDYTTRQLDESLAGREVAVGGVLAGVRITQTRRGDSMAVLTLEDLEGSAEVIVWPNHYEKLRPLIQADAPVVVRGRCDADARGEVKIICSDLLPLGEIWKNAVRRTRIRIPVSSLDAARLDAFHSLLQGHPGKCPVEFELLGERKLRVRLIPASEIAVHPGPSFLREVDNLFGQDSCILDVSQ